MNEQNSFYTQLRDQNWKQLGHLLLLHVFSFGVAALITYMVYPSEWQSFMSFAMWTSLLFLFAPALIGAFAIFSTL
jgi:hypothetical protein